jgi:hypothetical protein
VDADTRELLTGSIRAVLASRPGQLATELAELGWADVVSDDEAAAVELLFTEQGRAGAASSVLDGVVIAAGGGDLAAVVPHQQLVVHPFGSAVNSLDGDMLRVDGVALSEPAVGGCYVVAVEDRVYEVTAAAVTPAMPVAGFDPGSALWRVEFDAPVDGAVARECDWQWELAAAAARRALACELVGNGQAMLDLAVEHVAARHQFGRAIGANQSPRHRLAEAYVQLSAAHELVRIAWASDRPWDATVAKAYAGYAVDVTSRACMQVCGAMGLTAEFALGNYVKRSRILDALYGRWQQTTRAVGEELLASRVIPRGVGV